MADLETLPGVAAIASADHKPLGDDMAPIAIRLSGEDERQSRLSELTTVTHDYFSVLGLPILRGRGFTEEEVRDRRPGSASAQGGATAGLPRPVIVSETTARNLWPGRDPIGRTLLSAPAGMAVAADTLQVVGVVADAQINSLGRVDPYNVYVPGEGAALLIKMRADMSTMVPRLRAALRAVDPTLLLTVLPLEAALGWSRGISGTVTTLFGALGVLALVLASVGIYGVVSYAVAGRYREIGVRRALGASALVVLGMIVRQTMRPVIVGAALGVAAAGAVSRILSSVLFGVSAADPIGLGGASLLVLCVAMAAGIMAARPATRADPTVTLRCE